MAKNTLGEWSETASDNTDVGGINIAENCPAANINNAIREIMAQLAVTRAIADGGTGAGTEAGARTSLGLEIGVDVQAFDSSLASLSSPTTISNWNSAITAGFGFDDGNASNAPVAENLLALIVRSGARIWQLAFSEDGVRIYSRRSTDTGSNWSSWATLPVNLATQGEAEAGTSNSKLMTPLRVAQAIDEQVETPIGVGQTWQDVTGSRSANTSYQNTTGRPIFVAIRLGNGNRVVQVSPNNSSWIDVGNGASDTAIAVSFIVPNGYYYRIDGSNTPNSWSELR